MAETAGRVDAAGVKLSFQELGSGRATVLLPGGGPGCAAWSDFRPVVDRLGGGRRLILLDPPQYGESDAPAVAGPVFSYHARHVLAALDELAVGTADFVCQSLGGSVALRLAAMASDRVGRIVLTGSAPVPDPVGQGASGQAIREEYFGGDGPSEPKMAALLRTYEWFDPARLPAVTVRARYQASLRPAYRAVATDPAARGEPEDLTAHLPEVAAPVLLLWGAHDPFASPAYALRLAAALPRADVHVLARTSHHPQEERPAAYAAAARAFLAAEPDEPS